MKIKLNAKEQLIFQALLSIENDDNYVRAKKAVADYRKILKNRFGNYGAGNELYTMDGKQKIAEWSVRTSTQELFDYERFELEHPGIDIRSYFVRLSNTVPAVCFKYPVRRIGKADV